MRFIIRTDIQQIPPRWLHIRGLDQQRGADMDILLWKYCKGCNSWKLKTNFNKQKSNKDGLFGVCKSCWSIQCKVYKEKNLDAVKANKKKWSKEHAEQETQRKKKWYLDNAEKEKEKTRKRRAENPEKYYLKGRKWREENKDKANEYARVWRSANLEKSSAIKSKWQAENKDKVNEINQEWRKANPDKTKQYRHNRRASVMGNGGIIKAQEWKDLCNFYGNKCLCCGRSDVSLTLDHVIPLIKGGSNLIDNAQPLCQSCNSRKGVKSTDYRKSK